MQYPATTKALENGAYLITFADVPEAISEAKSLDDVADMAQDCLLSALEFYAEDGEALPKPSKGKQGDIWVSVPVVALAKLMLISELSKADISQAELARRMGVIPQQLTRLFDVRHKSRIEQVQSALSAIDKTLVLSVR